MQSQQNTLEEPLDPLVDQPNTGTQAVPEEAAQPTIELTETTKPVDPHAPGKDRDLLRILYRLVFWILLADLAAAAVVGGWRLRTWAWNRTESIRYIGDINNAFRIGTDANSIGFLDYYDHCAQGDEQGDARNVNYAPARLLIATQWARWVQPRIDPSGEVQFNADQNFYERARWEHQTYELCRPLLVLNSIMELLAAAGIFILVRHWMLCRWRPAIANVLGLLAAVALWFNPALICDAHCWPQWDAWLLPFLIWAMVAASGGYWFVAGALIAGGAMFKGQMLLGAPVLVLWPMWRGQWSAILKLIIGFFAAAAACTSVWLVRRDGVVAGTAIVWLIGIAVALAAALLQRRATNRYVKISVLSAALGLLIWPLFTGLIVALCAALISGLIITAAALLPIRWQGYIAAASLSAAMFLCAPVFGGSMAWFQVGIVSGTHMGGMHLGPTCNLPALLESQWGLSEMDAIATIPAGKIADDFGATMAALDRRFEFTPGLPVEVPLKTVLLVSYIIAMILCGLAAAMHDRQKSPRILLALTAPWLLMFALLPQMHERYLVWGAALCAMMIAISPGYFALGLLVTAIALSQQVALMIGEANSNEYPALMQFINGWTPGIGWALLLIALIFLYQSLVPDRAAKLRAVS